MSRGKYEVIDVSQWEALNAVMRGVFGKTISRNLVLAVSEDKAKFVVPKLPIESCYQMDTGGRKRFFPVLRGVCCVHRNRGLVIMANPLGKWPKEIPDLPGVVRESTTGIDFVPGLFEGSPPGGEPDIDRAYQMVSQMNRSGASGFEVTSIYMRVIGSHMPKTMSEASVLVPPTVIKFHEVAFSKFVRSLQESHSGTRALDEPTVKRAVEMIKAVFLPDQYEIVSGKDILWAYLESNYYRTEGATNLAQSCMRHEKCQKYLRIYTKYPDVIQLLVAKRQGKVVGRCLLWTSENGEVYFDRIYYHSESVARGMIKFLGDRGVTKTTYGQFSKNVTYAKVKCPKATQFETYPYMDSMYYIGKDYVSNKNSSGVWLTAHHTGGRVTMIRAKCYDNKVYKAEECGGLHRITIGPHKGKFGTGRQVLSCRVSATSGEDGIALKDHVVMAINGMRSFKKACVQLHPEAIRSSSSYPAAQDPKTKAHWAFRDLARPILIPELVKKLGIDEDRAYGPHSTFWEGMSLIFDPRVYALDRDRLRKTNYNDRKIYCPTAWTKQVHRNFVLSDEKAKELGFPLWDDYVRHISDVTKETPTTIGRRLVLGIKERVSLPDVETTQNWADFMRELEASHLHNPIDIGTTTT